MCALLRYVCIFATLLTSLTLSAQTLTTLYNFTAKGGNGYYPYSGVIIGPQGELYGTTPFGGAWKLGVVYELLPPSSSGGSWIEVPLHSFNSHSGDGQPTAGLLLGPKGILYGVTGFNGAPGGTTTFGTVYQLTPPSGAGTRWIETDLYHFSGSDGDGQNPEASLIWSGRSLYGTTSTGGTTQNGTAFSLTPPAQSGGTWTEAVLYSYQPLQAGGDGSNPVSALVSGANSVLYGTTEYSGAAGSLDAEGTVLKLAPPSISGGSWTETLLYTFTGKNGDGEFPSAGLVIDAQGVLYGTTWRGGVQTDNCSYGSLRNGLCARPAADARWRLDRDDPTCLWRRRER